MDGNTYQEKAKKFIVPDLSYEDVEKHALFGMCSEVGELHDIYQKQYQGHEFDVNHIIKECGDILWMLCEYCTAHNICLNDVMQINLDKLEARYPNGFEVERSLHRAVSDI